MGGPSLVELIAEADERGLAASGLACLDRCVPLLGGGDEVLRPLWGSLAEGGAWDMALAEVRVKLGGADVLEDSSADEAITLAYRMLGAVPSARSAAELREWADACSVAALQIHRLLDTAPDGGARPSSLSARREGRTDGMSPLVAAELRRQVRILELLANQGAGAGALRQALEVSIEGRRVLRAVVSRRERGSRV
ncbi:hypothetical protein M4V62_17435 [Streptomyces durmitorensis]|uniref:Uncharacterized protein n=1 Tax=Streptomyces durmitorensis TaxID=319947 RepID=A0ABY4PSA5_9ACTN|nr:hypothetical protein [Streptomyces durmitorensis]UQT56738.1 hypothetical protein M4V62_17435 [Streptomyces durmitorensis]